MTFVETNPEYETAGAELLEKETEEAACCLEFLKARALEEIPSCETIFRRGDSASRLIIEEAAQKKVDMIAVGRRGRSGLEKVLLGRQQPDGGFRSFLGRREGKSAGECR